MSPWAGMLMVLAALAVSMTAVRWLGAVRRWIPELSRKAVHVGMGLLCLTFPWVFRESWPVWSLAGCSVLGLLAVRVVPALRRRFGGVLGGVDRESLGDLLYAPAVAFVFWLAGGDPVLFCVPVLALALADTAAALVGRRYGSARIATDDGVKSFEGCTAFFVTAFVSTLAALKAASDLGTVEAVLVSVVTGGLLMFIELISWRGLDNVFVPVVAYVCLVRLVPLTSAELWVRLGVLAGLVTGFAILRRHTRFTNAAAIGSALVLYVSWAVGGWRWLVAPAATLVVYAALCRWPASQPRNHGIHAVVWISGTGLGWLCLADVIEARRALTAFSLGYATHLALVGMAFFADAIRGLRLLAAGVASVLLAWLTVLLPALVMGGPGEATRGGLIVGPAVLAASVAVFAAWQIEIRHCPTDPDRWVRQGLIGAMASMAGFVLPLAPIHL